MRYLLDTTILIDHALDQYGATALVEQLFSEPNALFLCDAVVAEATSKGTDDELVVMDALIRALEYIATTPAAARWAGEARRRLSWESGRRLADALIAGVAADLGAIVVTRNERDFKALGVPVLAYGG